MRFVFLQGRNTFIKSFPSLAHRRLLEDIPSLDASPFIITLCLCSVNQFSIYFEFSLWLKFNEIQSSAFLKSRCLCSCLCTLHYNGMRKAPAGFQPGDALQNTGGMFPHPLASRWISLKRLIQKLLEAPWLPLSPFSLPNTHQCSQTRYTWFSAQDLGPKCSYLTPSSAVYWPCDFEEVSYLPHVSVSPFIKWGQQQYLSTRVIVRTKWVNAYIKLGTVFHA